MSAKACIKAGFRQSCKECVKMRSMDKTAGIREAGGGITDFFVGESDWNLNADE